MVGDRQHCTTATCGRTQPRNAYDDECEEGDERSEHVRHEATMRLMRPERRAPGDSESVALTTQAAAKAQTMAKLC